MEKKMETVGIMGIIQGLYRDDGISFGIMEKRMETTTVQWLMQKAKRKMT